MSDADLTGVHLKLDRAALHLDALYASVATYLHENRNVFDLSLNRKGNCQIKINLKSKPDPGWGLLVGDFLHNTRSALDHLVWQLVVYNGDREPGFDNYFPVFATSAKWDADIVNRHPKRRGESPLVGVNDEHVALIKARQPFSITDTLDDAQRTHLSLLNEMWNIDKHRFMHAAYLFAGRAGTNPQIELAGTATISHLQFHLHAGEPLIHGKKFLTFRLGPGRDGDALKVRAITPLRVELVGIGSGPVWISELRKILDLVTEIVGEFDQVLA